MQAALITACATGPGAWGLLSVYSSWDEARLIGVVARISEGDSFRPDALQELEPAMERTWTMPHPKPTLIRAVAIIRLREAEMDLLAGKTASESDTMKRADQAVRHALSLIPVDGFLWFALAWITKERDGVTPSVIRALGLSYDMAEHEGWVAVRRNAFSVAIMPDLPPALQERVVAEFRNLVQSHYVHQAAAIITGSGWDQRMRLLRALEAVPEGKRQDLYREILDLGRDLDVPGVSRHPDRPWKQF